MESYPEYRIHTTTQGELVYTDFRFTRANGFEFKCNTPNAPTVTNTETKEVHEINKVWINDTIAFSPIHPILEHHLGKNVHLLETAVIHSSIETVELTFETPVHICGHTHVTKIEFQY